MKMIQTVLLFILTAPSITVITVLLNFTLNYHNKQCLYNRSEELCVECVEGFSLTLGSNQCEQYTNDHIALIIPFALAGIALVAFIITLNLTVSVGTINGFMLYANVVKIYENIFFPKGPIPFISWFISWVNLDLDMLQEFKT